MTNILRRIKCGIQANCLLMPEKSDTQFLVKVNSQTRYQQVGQTAQLTVTVNQTMIPSSYLDVGGVTSVVDRETIF